MEDSNREIRWVMNDLVRAYNRKKAAGREADRITGCKFCEEYNILILEPGAAELASLLDCTVIVDKEVLGDKNITHRFTYQGVEFIWLSDREELQ